MLITTRLAYSYLNYKTMRKLMGNLFFECKNYSNDLHSVFHRSSPENPLRCLL